MSQEELVTDVLIDNPASVERKIGGCDELESETKLEIDVLGTNSVEQVDLPIGNEKRENVNTEEVVKSGENLAEKKGVGREPTEGGGVGNGGSSKSRIIPDQNTTKEVNATPQVNIATAPDDNLVDEDLYGKREGEDSDGDGEDNEDSEDDEGSQDEEDPTMVIHDPLTERKKHKHSEIFVGKLDREAIEDDLKNVFGKFGEIKAARIARNSKNNKSKGFGFIQFASAEEAQNVLTELKDGIEIRGKPVKISASQDNDTLYVGNICKRWTKEHVLKTLKSYGIEHFLELRLPNDARNGRKNKGFAFVEFNSHSDAMAAFHLLRKSDAVFGLDKSVKVAFTQTPIQPNEHVSPQDRTVHVKGLTDAWNEDKVKEICKQYGEVAEVRLSRNFSARLKDFGFITFTSRESALACVDGINDAPIGEEVKIKASIAKSQPNNQQQKKEFREGIMVKCKTAVSSSAKENEMGKQAGSSKSIGNAKSNEAKRKQKAIPAERGKFFLELKTVKGNSLSIPQTTTDGQSVGAPTKLGKINRKRKNLPSEVKNYGNGSNDHVHGRRPSKKLEGNKRGRQSENFKKPNRDNHGGKGSSQGHFHSVISASKRHYSDMEPHAGYIEPVSRKHGGPYAGYAEPAVGIQGQTRARYFEPSGGSLSQPYAGYLEPTVGTRGRPQERYFEPTVQRQVPIHGGYLERAVGTQVQPHARYLESAVETQVQLHGRYLEPAVGTQVQPHGRYFEPAVGTQIQPHTGYLEPAVGNHGHHYYDPGLRRAVAHDALGSVGSSLVGVGSAVQLQPAYAHPNYTSYTGYQVGRNLVGYVQSSEALLPQRAYH